MRATYLTAAPEQKAQSMAIATTHYLTLIQKSKLIKGNVFRFYQDWLKSRVSLKK